MLHDNLQRIAPFSMSEALARHVLTSTEEGKFLTEPLLHCDLLLPDGADAAMVVVVLTGMRLLAVDSRSWRVQLNVPLRKLLAVTRGGEHVLTLQLRPRKSHTASNKVDPSPLPSSAPAPNEMRRLACHTEEAEVALHNALQGALTVLNARRRIWIKRSQPKPEVGPEVMLDHPL